MNRLLAGKLLLLLPAVARAGEQSCDEVIEVRKIWDQAPHNAFTDLIRFNCRWYCVFREGQGHVSSDGALRVITSDDGTSWESAALITSPTSELRDAKITVTPVAVACFPEPRRFESETRTRINRRHGFRRTAASGATGLVWHDGFLWVSYYASHEKKTSIYLEKVRFGS